MRNACCHWPAELQTDISVRYLAGRSHPATSQPNQQSNTPSSQANCKPSRKQETTNQRGSGCNVHRLLHFVNDCTPPLFVACLGFFWNSHANKGTKKTRKQTTKQSTNQSNKQPTTTNNCMHFSHEMAQRFYQNLQVFAIKLWLKNDRTHPPAMSMTFSIVQPKVIEVDCAQLQRHWNNQKLNPLEAPQIILSQELHVRASELVVPWCAMIP